MRGLGAVARWLKEHFPTLWRTAKVVVMLAVGLAILAAVAAIVLDIYGSQRLAAAKKEAAARGLRLSTDQVLADPEARTPNMSNAANYYEAAFAVLSVKGVLSRQPTVPLAGAESSPGMDRSGKERFERDMKRLEEDPRLPLPEYMLRDAKEFLAERQIALDLIAEGYGLPDSRYHVHWQGYSTLMPHLTKVRAAERIMALAAWVDAEENRPHEASATIRQGLALARSLRNEPALIAALVEMAGVSISLSQGLTRVVARTQVSDEDLKALQADIENDAETLSVRTAYEGELAMFCDFVDSIIDGRMTLAESLWSVRNPGATGGVRRWLQRRGILNLATTWLIKGYLKADEANAIRWHVRMSEHLDDPGPAFLSDPSREFEEFSGGPYILSRMMLPALSGGVEQCELTRARLRSAAAVLAALRFKRDTGKWPAMLDDLVPKYLSKVPIDPTTGLPLVYVVREDGILVYSVGENASDDGGKPYLVKPARGDTKGYDDVGFRLFTGKTQAGSTQ